MLDIFLVDCVGGLVGLAGLVLAITPTRSIEGAGRGGLKFSHYVHFKENPSNCVSDLGGRFGRW